MNKNDASAAISSPATPETETAAELVRELTEKVAEATLFVRQLEATAQITERAAKEARRATEEAKAGLQRLVAMEKQAQNRWDALSENSLGSDIDPRAGSDTRSSMSSVTIPEGLKATKPSARESDNVLHEEEGASIHDEDNSSSIFPENPKPRALDPSTFDLAALIIAKRARILEKQKAEEERLRKAAEEEQGADHVLGPDTYEGIKLEFDSDISLHKGEGSGISLHKGDDRGSSLHDDDSGISLHKDDDSSIQPASPSSASIPVGNVDGVSIVMKAYTGVSPDKVMGEDDTDFIISDRDETGFELGKAGPEKTKHSPESKIIDLADIVPAGTKTPLNLKEPGKPWTILPNVMIPVVNGNIRSPAVKIQLDDGRFLSKKPKHIDPKMTTEQKKAEQEKLKFFTVEEATRLAKRRGLDLVQMNPFSNICEIGEIPPTKRMPVLTVIYNDEMDPTLNYAQAACASNRLKMQILGTQAKSIDQFKDILVHSLNELDTRQRMNEAGIKVKAPLPKSAKGFIKLSDSHEAIMPDVVMITACDRLIHDLYGTERADAIESIVSQVEEISKGRKAMYLEKSADLKKAGKIPAAAFYKQLSNTSSIAIYSTVFNDHLSESQKARLESCQVKLMGIEKIQEKPKPKPEPVKSESFIARMLGLEKPQRIEAPTPERMLFKMYDHREAVEHAIRPFLRATIQRKVNQSPSVREK